MLGSIFQVEGKGHSFTISMQMQVRSNVYEMWTFDKIRKDLPCIFFNLNFSMAACNMHLRTIFKTDNDQHMGDAEQRRMGSQRRTGDRRDAVRNRNP